MPQVAGQIVSIESRVARYWATVRLDAGSACARCAAGKGCGAGLFGSSRQQDVEIEIPAESGLQAGDRIELAMQPGTLLKAAATVYGLPLAGAALAAMLTYTAANWLTAGAVLLGMALGWWLAKARLAGNHCLAQYVPTVVGAHR